MRKISRNIFETEKIVNTLGDEHIKIVAITGETPDANRDYELF